MGFRNQPSGGRGDGTTRYNMAKMARVAGFEILTQAVESTYVLQQVQFRIGRDSNPHFSDFNHEYKSVKASHNTNVEDKMKRQTQEGKEIFFVLTQFAFLLSTLAKMYFGAFE